MLKKVVMPMKMTSKKEVVNVGNKFMNNTNEQLYKYILEIRRTIYSIECNLNKLELLLKETDKLKDAKLKKEGIKGL